MGNSELKKVFNAAASADSFDYIYALSLIKRDSMGFSSFR